MYVRARFSRYELIGMRFGGAGFCNLLFPWARSILFARDHQLPIISSNWGGVKFGTLFRRERDGRFYKGLMQDGDVDGLQKAIVLLSTKRISESQIDELSEFKEQVVVEFSGLANQMSDILGESEYIRERLVSCVSAPHLESISDYKSCGISVHIRLGDFAPWDDSYYYSPSLRTNVRLPLEWYVEIISKLRSQIGYDVPVDVFSDGSDEEIERVLNLPNVRRRHFGSAVSDLIALSRSNVLVASNSTFSLWASYLGRMPVVWFPGCKRIDLYEKTEPFEIELGMDDQFPMEFQSRLLSSILGNGPKTEL